MEKYINKNVNAFNKKKRDFLTTLVGGEPMAIFVVLVVILKKYIEYKKNKTQQ
jgi:hypothetical protein